MGKLRQRNFLIKCAILLAVLIPLAIFVAGTDFRAVARELQHFGFRFIFVLLVSFVAYLLGTWAWYVCLGEGKAAINVRQLFIVRQVSEIVGTFNPTSIIGGDLLKVNLLKSYAVLPQASRNSVLISRITAILSQIFLFIVAIAWFVYNIPLRANLELMLYFVVAFLIAAKLILFAWLFSPLKAVRPVEVGESPWRKFIYKLRCLVYDTKYFARQYKAVFWQSYLLFALHWFVGSTEFVLILSALGLDVNLMQGLLMDMGVIMVKSLGAVVPGQIGVEELGNKLMLGVVGVASASVWLTVSIIRRARQLCWIAIGFLLYILLKRQLPKVIV